MITYLGLTADRVMRRIMITVQGDVFKYNLSLRAHTNVINTTSFRSSSAFKGHIS